MENRETNLDWLDNFVIKFYEVIFLIWILWWILSFIYILFKWDFNILWKLWLFPIIYFYMLVFLWWYIWVFFVTILDLFIKKKNKYLSVFSLFLHELSLLVVYFLFFYIALKQFIFWNTILVEYFFTFWILVFIIWTITESHDWKFNIIWIYSWLWFNIMLLFDLFFLFLDKSLIYIFLFNLDFLIMVTIYRTYMLYKEIISNINND